MFLLTHPIVKVLPDKRVWQRDTSCPPPHAFYFTGPSRGGLGEGRARRSLSVIQIFKNRCHVIYGRCQCVNTVGNTLKTGIFWVKNGIWGQFCGFSSYIH